MGNNKKIFEYFCLKLTPTVQQVYTWSTKKIIPNGHFFVIRYMLSIVWFIIQNKWHKCGFTVKKYFVEMCQIKTCIGESFATMVKHKQI